jgi:hypothetical protein
LLQNPRDEVVDIFALAQTPFRQGKEEPAQINETLVLTEHTGQLASVGLAGPGESPVSDNIRGEGARAVAQNPPGNIRKKLSRPPHDRTIRLRECDSKPR